MNLSGGERGRGLVRQSFVVVGPPVRQGAHTGSGLRRLRAVLLLPGDQLEIGRLERTTRSWAAMDMSSIAPDL